MNEKIICAAIWYKEMETPVHRPTNISQGVVVCGHRHSHCIGTMIALTGLKTKSFGEEAVGEHIQGFLTNTNRFVDRKEALEIAAKENQLLNPLSVGNILFSEDIY